MQLIVKCPECGKQTLAMAGRGGVPSEVINSEQKDCAGCGKRIKIDIRIKVTIAKAEEAKT